MDQPHQLKGLYVNTYKHTLADGIASQYVNGGSVSVCQNKHYTLKDVMVADVV